MIYVKPYDDLRELRQLPGQSPAIHQSSKADIGFCGRDLEGAHPGNTR